MLRKPFLLLCLLAAHTLYAPLVNAAPIAQDPTSLAPRAPTHDVIAWLCGQPYFSRTCDVTRAAIAKVSSTFAAGTSSQDPAGTTSLPLGRAAGAKLAGVTRYTLPYAKAPVGSLRFQPPAPLAAWNGILDATNLPPACPQSSLLSPTPSTNEDCLFMNVFVPTAAKSSSKLPVFVWLHGGSFVSGSTSDAAIDGSLLAEQGNLIVVTMQYRLGMLGFLHAPSSGVEGNMAVLDAVEGLTFIQKNIAAFGGNAAAITLAGQSSGASLIKSLLTVPRADALFHKVILQSAPLAYGDHSRSTAAAVGQLFTSQPGIKGCADLACLQALPVDALLAAQDEVFRTAPFAAGPHVSAAEPIRPFIDGSTVVQQFERVLNTGGLNNKNRPIIITTTRNEAGPTIAGITSDAPLPATAFPTVVQALLDPARSSAVLSSGLYPVSESEPDAARTQLELLGTDLIWRCSAQQTAVNATRSGNAEKGLWLAEFDLGIPYTSNLGIKFCQGKVCHQDDIEAVFSTGGDDITQAQQALEREIVARWASFARSGSPNPSGSGYLRWDPVSVSRTDPHDIELNMLRLDGTHDSIAREQRKVQCGPDSLFGARVPFDQQVYSAA